MLLDNPRKNVGPAPTLRDFLVTAFLIWLAVSATYVAIQEWVPATNKALILLRSVANALLLPVFMIPVVMVLGVVMHYARRAING